MEGLNEHEDTGGDEKDTSETEPVETGEDIQEIKASNPHDNTKCGIKIEQNEGGDALKKHTLVCQDRSEVVFDEVNRNLDQESGEVEDKGRVPPGGECGQI